MQRRLLCALFAPIFSATALAEETSARRSRLPSTTGRWPSASRLPACRPHMPRRRDLDAGQRQRHLHQSAFLRRVFRSGPDPRRRRLLPDRHHHAHHAGAADPALEGPGQLGVRRATPSTSSTSARRSGWRAARNIYGQGIWAPCFRYHNGTFYIFANVNGQATQMFTATDPRGPWTRTPMKRRFHDLSVLFDDDGKVYVVWGHRTMHLAQLTRTLTDIVPGTERVLFTKDARDGRGRALLQDRRQVLHHQRQLRRRAFACRRRGRIALRGRGRSIDRSARTRTSASASGHAPGHAPSRRSTSRERRRTRRPDIGLAMHQGGIVQTPAGEWWGFSMMDLNSVGRLLGLSPITWKDGWPYFGLPGNLDAHAARPG